MELKVGDRVRLTEYGSTLASCWKGKSNEGTVDVIYVSEYGFPYVVEWDCGRRVAYRLKEIELADNINEEELYY